jgi:hypothetical protein
LEKEWGYKESHFEFIHQHIRRICLSCNTPLLVISHSLDGATLLYVSAKKDRHVMTLFNYIKHRLYGYDFVTKPSLEKETIFFPAGYDSLAKIKVDFQNQNLTRDPNDPYEEIIRMPKALVVAVRLKNCNFLTFSDL